MSDVSKIIAGLRPDQLEKLQQRMNEKRVGPARTRIPAQPRTENVFPLSFGQQQFWVLNRLEPESARYNVPTAVRLNGQLDVAALARSLNEVVRRHESLRTSFAAVGGRLVQIIEPELTLNLTPESLQHLPESEREAEVWRLGAIEAETPFNLTYDPLLRVKLLKLSDDEHVLLITTHHIVCDKWSHGVFMQELASLYTANVLGQPAVLPPLPVQMADFACWQREWLQGAVLDEHLAYWKSRLGDAPPALDLPTDHPRSSPQPFRAGKLPFVVNRELLGELKALGQREETTLFMTLLAGFKAVLQRFADQENGVVAFITANRNRPETVNLIGQLSNTLLLNTAMAPAQTFREVLATVRTDMLGAYAHQDLPFERLVEELQPEREAGKVPLFQVAFNLQKAPPVDMRLPKLTLTPFEIYRGPFHLDIYFEIEERDEELVGTWEYNAELFDDETIERLMADYRRLLELCAATPELKLGEFEFQPELSKRIAANRARDRKSNIAIAATFTAEPIEDALAFWMDTLESPSVVNFAPYNQVFQQLLDPSSLLATNRDGVNVLLVRLEDWQRFTASDETGLSAEKIERNAHELVTLLKAAVERAVVPYLVCLCPASTEVEADPENAALLTRVENLIETELEAVRGVYVITSDELKQAYDVGQRDNRQSDRLGHIPYTETFFAALGTTIARKLHALRSAPYKVVVLDCDQTLWRGVCAEDGILGVSVDAAHRDLQEFMLAQHRAGMLLCLCSRNEEADVFEVFANHPDMVLKREHIVASRINWKSKSENIKSLAAELQLALDSFVFIDDDPVVCADVEANCPEVLTINLMDSNAHLRRMWAFDRLKVTAEDRQRTDFYQQNAVREQLRQSAPNFQEFLAGLELEVEISPLSSSNVSRVSQLLERTTQFNSTGLRLTETELARLLETKETECLVVEVRDRFGDYGLVGTVLFKTATDALVVDSFALSCRALGRGVEHRMLNALGAAAARHGLGRVDVRFIKSKRNRPAEEFFVGVGQEFREQTLEGALYKLPAEIAAAFDYRPDDAEQSSLEKPEERAELNKLARTGLLRRISSEFSTIDQILHAVELHKRRARTGSGEAFVAPRTPVEEIVAEIFQQTLGVERIGVHDNFFRLGGHSVLATMLVAKVADSFAMDLSLRAFFDAPTVAAMAEAIELYQIQRSDSDLIAELDDLSDEEVKALLASEGELVRQELSEA